jgi:RNA polymerase sigma factor (sigma-70 family)
MAILDIEQWLPLAIQGDEVAARELVERLYPLVIRIVRAHLPRRMAEEDLAQEVFIKMFSRLPQYRLREGVPFEHWVARLAVHTCLDSLRAERRRPELRLTDLGESDAEWLAYLNSAGEAPPDGSAEDARAMVEKLLAQLPPQDRLVITLLDLEQKTVREIGQLTGMNMTLIKVRAFRARRKLRRLAERLSP